MCYDQARNEIVYFGGYTGGVWVNETWIWDGTAWTQKVPAHSPAARSSHMMCYDPITQKDLLFGGISRTDSWLWDGTDWTQISTTGNPFGNIDGAMGIDPVNDRIIHYGGGSSFDQSDQTWAWTGSNWSRLYPATVPFHRSLASASHDTTHNYLLMYGGAITNTSVDETWKWTGSNWVQLFPNDNPGVVTNHALGFSPSLGLVYYEGGRGGIAPDLMRWDGSNWVLLTAAGSPPMSSPRTRFAGFEDRDVFILSTGYQQTWELEYVPPPGVFLDVTTIG